MDFQELPVSPGGDGWGRGRGRSRDEQQPRVCKTHPPNWAGPPQGKGCHCVHMQCPRPVVTGRGAQSPLGEDLSCHPAPGGEEGHLYGPPEPPHQLSLRPTVFTRPHFCLSPSAQLEQIQKHPWYL